jgi:hypothetical protein
MYQKVKKDDLKVGDRVLASDGGGLRIVANITGATANLNGWSISLRSDGYWGGDGSSGFLQKDDGKVPKVIIAYAVEGRGDPVEEFQSMDDAKKRVSELVVQTSPRVVSDSIRVYDISKAFKISTTITYKQMTA